MSVPRTVPVASSVRFRVTESLPARLSHAKTPLLQAAAATEIYHTRQDLARRLLVQFGD